MKIQLLEFLNQNKEQINIFKIISYAPKILETYLFAQVLIMNARQEVGGKKS